MLDFKKDGVTEKIPIGEHFRKDLILQVGRFTHILRLLFDAFDTVNFGKSEKEAQVNCDTLRGYILTEINDRKKKMATPGYTPESDFISILLSDELFARDSVAVIDECVGLMAAAT